MAFITEFRRSTVAVKVALSGQFGRSGRLIGIRVFFPDVGPSCVVSLGYLRYAGEPCFTEGDPDGAVTPAGSDHLL